MSTWRQLETAPRDGTNVLFVSPAGDYSVGRWDGDGWDMQSAPPRSPFTHWMPLPAPPPAAAVFARARALWDEHAAEVRPVVEAGWTATVSDWEFDRQPPETIERFLARARAMPVDPPPSR